MTSIEKKNYRRATVPDVLNVYHEQTCDAKLANAVIFNRHARTKDSPFDALVRDTLRIQQAYNDRLTLAVIDKKLPPVALDLVRKAKCVLTVNKADLARRLNDPNIPLHIENTQADLTSLTAQRLIHVATLPDTPHVLDTRILKQSPTSTFYLCPSETGDILGEALSLFPLRKKLVGFQITQETNKQTVDFYMCNDNKGLTKLSQEIDEASRRNIDGRRKKKRILIAVEGDIAGHALRALDTARALRHFGYDPAVVGNGYYMKPFIDEGFTRLPPFSSEQNTERERIISRARGEGIGLFFWGFRPVNARISKYKSALVEYVKNGVDLFVADMNPIADIAVGHLQRKNGKFFPSLTQTHDIRLSPTRMLRTLKVVNIPVGEVLYTINHSRLAQIIDPTGCRFRATHFLFNELADVVMGLPLSVSDRVREPYEPKFPRGNPRLKFTDYIHGRNGTFRFGIASEKPDEKIYPVGLQADRGNKTKTDSDEWETTILDNKPIVLNTQGSTYHKEAWSVVTQALSENPSLFSVHTTGKKEDVPSPLYASKRNGRELTGYKVGYAAGYRLSQIADLVINHGGFGTISQWLLATSERILDDQRALDKTIGESGNLEIVNQIKRSKSVARSLSLCNTFEQENNALALNEMGGNNVCTVIPVDILLRSPNPTWEIEQLTAKMLTTPIDNSERAFWLDTVRKVSTMNAPAHIALAMEHIMAITK